MAKKNGQKVSLEEKQRLTKVEALIHAESFYHYKLIARAAGITDETLKTYRDEDEEFSQQLEQARARFLNKNMRKARPEFLLERLEPEYFKLRQETEHKGNLGVGISDDQLDQLIKARARRSDTKRDS